MLRRSFAAAALVGAGALVATACRKPPPPEPAVVAPAVPDAGPSPLACQADQDCVPADCCYAREATSCLLRKRAHCDTVEVSCGEYRGQRYTCACTNGRCLGVSPTGESAETAAPAAASWATGALSASTVLDVIMQHAADVRTCKATARNFTGMVQVHWTIGPSGAVLLPKAGASGVLPACLARKVAGWRFPQARGTTDVTYGFRFEG